MRQKILSFLAMLFCVFLFSACSVTPKQAYQGYQPEILPVRNVTHFEQSLNCLKNLLDYEQVKPLYLTSEGIPHSAEGKLNSGIDMLISTITQLNSDKVIFVVLPSDSNVYIRQPDGTTQTSPKAIRDQIILMNQIWESQFELVYPKYNIKGSISQVDKGVISQGAGGSITLSDVDFGINKDDIVSVITVDMNVYNTATFQLQNGVNSANSIAVYRQGLAGDLGGRIKKAGAYLNFSFDKSEGAHQAIRTLIQLNTIEVIGELAKVPYQQCLTAYDADESTRMKAIEENQQIKSKPLEFQITPTKHQFQLNDVFRFDLKTSDNAFVHCFFQNYEGTIWRIFPNQVQSSDYLLANESISIPQVNEHFQIELDTPNVNEQVMCLASRNKLQSDYAYNSVSTANHLKVKKLDHLLENYKHKTKGNVISKTMGIKVD